MSQRSLVIKEKLAPFEIIERPIPKPGKGEVLVKIHSAALNPVDWKIQKHGAFLDTFPAVLGSDCAGVVEALGEGVESLAKGDKVFHQGWPWEMDKGIFQQYTIVPAEIVAKLPPSGKISFDQAASIPLGIATAAVGFYNPIDNCGLGYTPAWESGGEGKYSDQSLIILGGSSSVGQYTIQFARMSGFNPIITTSSTKHEGWLKSLGATHVLDRHTNVEAAVKTILPDGADIVYDAISGGPTQKLAITLVKKGGSILLTLPAVSDFKPQTDTKVQMAMGNVHLMRPLGRSLYKVLPSLLETGAIKPNRVEVVPGGLGAIPGGLDRMAADQVSGIKLIVHPLE